jgi:tetratricopeptide (TPR) repeat protein
LAVDELRAEAAIRARDEATTAKRVADMKTVRAQMAPWAKMFSPELVALLDANEAALLARAHAAAKPSPASQKSALDALARIEHLESTQSTSGGPEWQRTSRETLGDALLAAGKGKEALAQFERDLEEHPKRAIALLGTARAAKASGDSEKARARYQTLAELWSDADADLAALGEVRAGAK